jgi:hypothetical protein
VSRVLVLAGGSPHAHDFSASGAALLEFVSGLGHETDLVDDPDEAAAALAEFDALVVDGLWWRMIGEAYDQWRDDYAYSSSAATRDALSSFVRAGGGMLAMHTASISFDDWPEWGRIVGGAWRWGVSSHPPYGPVSVRIVADHPVVSGLPPTIELDDEIYGDLALCDEIEVLAVCRRGEDDDDQPVVWAHRFGEGRVVYDGFGHDVASIRHPQHARLLQQALAWILEAG